MIWIAILFCMPELSYSSDFLTGRQIERLRRQVNEYFRPGGGNPKELAFLQPRFSILQTVLREARVHHEKAGGNTVANSRADALLRILAAKSRNTGVPEGSRLRLQLHQDLNYFLKVFHHHGLAGEAVVEMYDRWRMWGPEELWIFLPIRDSTRLMAHIGRLRVMMPRLSDFQLNDLATALRGMSPKSTLQYMLLLETGHMLESELVAALGMASRQFAKAFERRDLMDDDAFMLFALENPLIRAVDRGLRLIMDLLGKKDPLVGSAFSKAVENASRASDRDYDPANRLLFFVLLQEGRLDWSDRASWVKRAKEIEKEKIPLKHRYRVEGDVILVQFRPKPECEGDLDP